MKNHLVLFDFHKEKLGSSRTREIMLGETILLVEDHDAIAIGIQFGLEKEGYRVERAAFMADGLDLVKTVPFDLAILDIGLPDGSGLDLCRNIRKLGHNQPILMLTGNDDTLDKVLGLELGADDYLTKPYELRELVARIRALLRRSYGTLANATPMSVTVGDLEVNLADQRVSRNEQPIHLTAIEFKLLAFLAQNPNKPYSRDQLLTNVWGYDDFVGDARTVDVHIRNLRRKIEVEPNSPKFIVTVRKAGYKLVK